MPGPKIAIVQEWVSARAGSELVFENLAAAFPNADLYALTKDPAIHIETGGRQIRTTILQRSGTLSRRRDLSLPLMPIAWRTLSRANYDLVVTSTHAFAREFVRPGDGAHACYVHAPMRYAWTPELDGRGGTSAAAGLARRSLQRIDKRSVRRVQGFASNSREVASRIEQFYGRRSSVIHPPVPMDDLLKGDAERRGFALCLSRFIPYKRIEIAIQAADRVGIDLVVAGSGPELESLSTLAAATKNNRTTVEIGPSRARLVELMQTASVFVFPAFEDFGIVCVEAQAAGLPVVALDRGGTADSVIDGVTGALAGEQTTDSFAAAIERCLSLRLTAEDCRAHAKTFSPEIFRKKIRSWAQNASALELTDSDSDAMIDLRRPPTGQFGGPASNERNSLRG